jgi:drug/metabolite transporter (DMT)-like permease
LSIGAQAEKPVPASLYAAMALMTVLWSMNYYAAKVVTAELWPFAAAGLRSVFGALAIGLYYFVVHRDSRETGGAWQTLRFMGLGTIGVSLNQYFFMEGMSRTSVAHGALIIALTPAIVLVLAVLAGQEHITRWKVAGLVLATSGIACLQLGADKSKAATLVGDLIVFGASTSFATYTVLSKRLAANAQVRASGMTVVTYGFIGSALLFMPGLIWALPRLPLASIGVSAWMGLAYMSIATSAICYAIYYQALEALPASRVSALSYLQPLLAITTAIPLLGEPITKMLVAGGALILAGVVLAERG